MKYALNSEQAREIDRIAIEDIGIPSSVLMEKAALGVAYAAQTYFCPGSRILVVCGTGNNGGDGLAGARLLHSRGWNVTVYLVGDRKLSTKETKLQLKIAKNSGVNIVKKVNYSDFDGIVDAIFGIGLSRPITGDLYKEIEKINDSGKPIVSVDIPSGVSADDGKILGIAVRANMTVTFGHIKIGTILYPGAEYSGKVVLWDIDTSVSTLSEPPKCFYYDETPELLLPKRRADSNKGTYGKVLVIAGSKNMSGAAFFAASAAYRIGAGLVRVLTTEDNREVLQKQLPEAVLTTYGLSDDGGISEKSIEDVKEAVSWADVILIGPGLGQGKASATLVSYVITVCKCPLVIDADGINILSKIVSGKTKKKNTPADRIKALSKMLPKDTILTPHKMELSRLTGVSMAELAVGMITASSEFTKGNDLIFVKKDVRTIVSFGDSNYINVTGNDGMATAGSGDVLGGIIAGLIAQGEKQRSAAMTGCYIHGLCGNTAAAKKGKRSMIASDILEAIPEVIGETNDRQVLSSSGKRKSGRNKK